MVTTDRGVLVKVSILDEIIEVKRGEIARSKQNRPLASLMQEAEKAPKPLGFTQAIMECIHPAIIAEIKRASPSRGIIRQDLDPALTSANYAAAGAACLSVLTDEKFFSGHLDFIKTIKSEISAPPILRKDFIIDPYQIWQSRCAQADAVLLIAAALDSTALELLYKEALQANLDVLIEVHDITELDQVISMISRISAHHSWARLPLLGINNRDLKTFKTDLKVTEQLTKELPALLSRHKMEPNEKELIIVAESGIFCASDIQRLTGYGARAFLIGESLVAKGNPGDNLARLISEVRNNQTPSSE